MDNKLTDNQKQVVEILKSCLKMSNTNSKYSLVYLTKNNLFKLGIYSNLKNFTGEGFYIVKLTKVESSIVYPRFNGNTINSLINKKIIKIIARGQYELNVEELNNSDKPNVKNKLETLKNKLENKEYNGFKEKMALVKDIKRIEYALEGRDFDKEQELERKAREDSLRRIKEFDEKSKELAIKLSKEQELPMPKGANYMYYDKPFSRAKTKAYRGEFKEKLGTGSNTGTAMYGQGIYTTTNKAYAKKFGEVREVTIDELPAVPLRFNNQNDFNQFEYILSESLGIKKTDLHLVGEINDIICRLGYDGATIGTGKDMIIVKYFNKK